MALCFRIYFLCLYFWKLTIFHQNKQKIIKVKERPPSSVSPLARVAPHHPTLVPLLLVTRWHPIISLYLFLPCLFLSMSLYCSMPFNGMTSDGFMHAQTIDQKSNNQHLVDTFFIRCWYLFDILSTCCCVVLTSQYFVLFVMYNVDTLDNSIDWHFTCCNPIW